MIFSNYTFNEKGRVRFKEGREFTAKRSGDEATVLN